MGEPNYSDVIWRMKRRWGDKFVEPTTTPDQRRYFNGPRVEITSPNGYVRRGRISITTGWAPALLLVHRRNAHGSSDLLYYHDRVTAIINERGKRIPL